MAQVRHSYRRPSWWGPDWIGFPVAFWVSVVASAAATFALEEVLLRLLLPSFFKPHGDYESLNAAGDYYAAISCCLGALPVALFWKRALHRRGFRSWDD
jgi:hypothetical protein